MIKQLEGSETAQQEFVVCDIENYVGGERDGEVFLIDTCWDHLGVEKHIQHFTWEDWWEWLKLKGMEDKKFRRIYAHNGGGWDWLSLAEYLISVNEKIDVAETMNEDGEVDGFYGLTAVTAGSRMITMSVSIDKRYSIHLCDSLQLLRSSLDDLARKFKVGEKADLKGLLPHELWEKSPKHCIKYCKHDCSLLLKVLNRALALIREHIAPIPALGMTVGSTAMMIFRTMMSDEITIPFCPIFKSFLRRAYTGGRVEVFQYGEFHDINVYDVNSLYPTAMKTTKVPTSDRVKDSTNYHQCGVYEIVYHQIRRDVPAVLMEMGRGSYKGRGVFFSPEIQLLKEIDPLATIDIIRGYAFIDTAYIFSEFVDKLYALRLSDPKGPVDLLCKFFLNSLYGKFGQHSERSKIVMLPMIDDIIAMVKDGFEPEPLKDGSAIHKITVESDCKFEHVGIAGMITSAARVILYRGLLSAGIDKIIYCDTDSVHTTGTLPPQLVGYQLGQFKPEFQGSGVYAGKKLYALRDPLKKDTNDKIRAKGVTVLTEKSKKGARLTYEDMVKIAEGGEVACEFSQPSSAMEVFTGRRLSCQFQKRKRKLRKT